MLAVIPLVTFFTIAFLVASLFSNLGWRHVFLRASLLWGAWLVFTIEVLSFFRAVTQVGLTFMWLLLAGVCTVWLIKRWRKGLFPRSPDIDWLKNPGYVIMLLLLLLIFIVVGLVAWFAPPNTYDSLNYHMPRVAHWAQNRSVAHYVTGVDRQNTFAPFAEYSVLNSYVLTGGDHLVNFTNWFAMISSVIGVTVAAALLGAPLAGQFLAGIFVATLPMGIAQASSTMTDYVTGFWVVCVALEFLLLWTEQKTNWRTVFFLSLAAGLAFATKSTAFTFLLPFAIATAVLLFKKTTRMQFVELVALTVLVVGLVNAGYVTRNLRTYGAPLDPQHSRDFPNQMLDWRGVVSTTLRTAVFQLHTPWDALNHQLLRLVVGIHFKMGVDVNDPRSTVIGEFRVGRPSTHEDILVNPLHTFLIFTTAAISLFTVKRTGRRVLYYQLLVLAGFVAFSFMLKWQIFGSRLLLPFFLIAAPAFGVVFGAILSTWAATVVGMGLVVSSFIWLVSLYSRPLIPLPGKTEWPSVLTASREQMYFTSIPGAYEPMRNVANQILDAGCMDVGMAISGAGAEYPYWVLLAAPRDDLRIEWIVAGTPSARYLDPDFQPCAVICDTCDGRQSFRGLPLVDEQGKIKLYLQK